MLVCSRCGKLQPGITEEQPLNFEANTPSRINLTPDDDSLLHPVKDRRQIPRG
jgi:hypothetical protein